MHCKNSVSIIFTVMLLRRRHKTWLFYPVNHWIVYSVVFGPRSILTMLIIIHWIFIVMQSRGYVLKQSITWIIDSDCIYVT